MYLTFFEEAVMLDLVEEKSFEYFQNFRNNYKIDKKK